MCIVAVVAGAISVAAAPPALADRCEPTEPVVRLVLDPNYEEPGDEDAKVHCAVIDEVYNFIMCDQTPTLLDCVDARTGNIRDKILNPNQCLAQPVVPSLLACLSD